MHNPTILNADSFSSHARQSIVLSMFEGLNEGADFILQSGHDPSAICSHLDSLQRPNLQWEYVEKTRGQWKIRISKRTKAQAGGGCCGSCGG